jgi:hypothetical protein
MDQFKLDRKYTCAVCGYTTTDTRRLTYGNNTEDGYTYGDGSIRCTNCEDIDENVEGE